MRTLLSASPGLLLPTTYSMKPRRINPSEKPSSLQKLGLCRFHTIAHLHDEKANTKPKVVMAQQIQQSHHPNLHQNDDFVLHEQEELEIARAQDRDARVRRMARRRKRRMMTLILTGAYLFLFSKKAIRRRRHQFLRAHNMISSTKRSLRAAVCPPEESPWHYFLTSGVHDEATWHDWVGMPEEGFHLLVQDCQQIWMESSLRDENGTPKPCHLAQRDLDCTGTVGFFLACITKQGTVTEIGKLFGLINTTAQKYFEFGARILLPVLRANENARIHWNVQDFEYLERCADLVKEYEPRLFEVYGLKAVFWMDGVRYRIANKWSDPKSRKKDRSGEKKMTLRKMILVFDPFGKCVAAVWNIPGGMGESRATEDGGIYEKIRTLPDGYCGLVDTAYRGHVYRGKLIRIVKVGQFVPDGMTQEQLSDLEEVIIRGRQPSEWGNCQFVQFARRLRTTLSIDDVFNGKLMELSLLPHNFRLQFSDRNELKRVFLNFEAFRDDPELLQELNTF